MSNEMEDWLKIIKKDAKWWLDRYPFLELNAMTVVLGLKRIVTQQLGQMNSLTDGLMDSASRCVINLWKRQAIMQMSGSSYK